MRNGKVLTAGLSILLAASAGIATAAEKVYRIKADYVYVGDGTVLKEAEVIVRGGKIVAVGRNLAPTPYARVLTAHAVMPGLIDIHSHMCSEHSPMKTAASRTSVPARRASDRWDPNCMGRTTAMAGGVTTIVYRPGSTWVIGGAGAAIKLKAGASSDIILRDPVDVKMAIGVGDKRREVATVKEFLTVARRRFRAAAAYEAEWDRYRREGAEGQVPPRRDLGLEFLGKALRREIPVHAHTEGEGAEDAVMTLAREFGLKVVFAHAVVPYKFLDKFPPADDLTLNIGPSYMRQLNPAATHPTNVAAVMSQRGYRVTLQTDEPAQQGLLEWGLRYVASSLHRYGLDATIAIRSVTADAAIAANLEDRIGTLAVGKDADLLLLDGEPLEFSTQIDAVMIDGQLEYRNPLPAHTGTILSQGPASVGPLPLPASFNFPNEYAVIDATLITLDGAPITDGTLLVSNGRIQAVGKNLKVPSGMPKISLPGRYIMPGLVKAVSIAGFSPIDSTASVPGSVMKMKYTGDPTPNLASGQFREARMLGVTTSMSAQDIMFGGAALGSRGIIVKTGGDDGMAARVRPGLVSAALGSAAVKQDDVISSTELGVAARLRQTMMDARRALAMPRDLRGPQEAELVRKFGPVLLDQEPLLVSCESAADILTAIRIGDEFGIRLVLLPGALADFSEALVREIVKRRIPVILDTYGLKNSNLRLLAQGGVKFGFRFSEAYSYQPMYSDTALASPHMGDPLAVAAIAVGLGVSEEAALRAVTSDVADIIGMSERIGTLTAGKDADFLVLSGPPLATATLPELVVIEGRVVARNAVSDYTRLPQQPK